MLRTGVKVILQVVSFRNIDVCCAGEYRLLVEMEWEEAETREICKATATNLSPSSFYVSAHSAEISPTAYLSPSFHLSYSDECVSICDLADFLLDISTLPGLVTPPVRLQVTLLHLPESIPPKEVGRGVVNIHAIAKGVHEYTEIGIDLKAAVGVMVHAESVSWEYRPGMRETQGEDVPISLGEFLFPGFSSRHPTDSDLYRIYIAYLSPLLSHISTISTSFPPFFPSFDINKEAEIAISWENFKEIFGEMEGEMIGEVIIEELQRGSGKLKEVLEGVRREMGEEATEFYKELYAKMILQQHSDSVHHSPRPVDSVPLISVSDFQSDSFNSTFFPHRIAPNFPPNFSIFPAFSRNSKQIFYHESYENEEKSRNLGRKKELCGVHLYVFVPGYGSTNADMRLIKNTFAWYFPHNSQFLVSSSNDGHTDWDIISLGKSLASEVQTHISRYCQGSLRRLSFIGHSLGGVIVRSAVRFLMEYRTCLGVFVSLSCPHLGLMYGKSKWVKAGLWVLESFKRSNCIKQLKMKDNSDLRQTFLYKLSESEDLNLFDTVLLFSSLQDKMVPLESARMELCARAQDGSERGCFFLELLERLLSPLPPCKLHRILVDFSLSDSAIGRKAHIEFITNRVFMEILCTQFHDFLR